MAVPRLPKENKVNPHRSGGRTLAVPGNMNTFTYLPCFLLPRHVAEEEDEVNGIGE